jgi:hypothetical protein
MALQMEPNFRGFWCFLARNYHLACLAANTPLASAIKFPDHHLKTCRLGTRFRHQIIALIFFFHYSPCLRGHNFEGAIAFTPQEQKD